MVITNDISILQAKPQFLFSYVKSIFEGIQGNAKFLCIPRPWSLRQDLRPTLAKGGWRGGLRPMLAREGWRGGLRPTLAREGWRGNSPPDAREEGLAGKPLPDARKLAGVGRIVCRGGNPPGAGLNPKNAGVPDARDIVGHRKSTTLTDVPEHRAKSAPNRNLTCVFLGTSFKHSCNQFGGK